MFKKKLLSRYIEDQRILHIISHHWRVYVKLIIKFVVLLLIGFGWYWYVGKYFDWKWISIGFGIYWLILYVTFIIAFMDLYLDSLVLTDQGISLFFWEGLFKYSNELLERASVEAVYDEQDGLLDIILNKWDVKIKRAEAEYVFDEIPKPSSVSALILSVKEEILNQDEDSNNQEEEIDKFQLLVEALGEIIKEFYSKR